MTKIDGSAASPVATRRDDVLQVTDEGLAALLPCDPRPGLGTVYFDGRRVWTFRADHGRWTADQRTFTVSWPEALLPRLSGRANVDVEFSRLGETPVSGSAEFGGSRRPLALVDPVTAEPLVVSKTGRLGRSFESRSPEFLDGMLDAAERLIALLASEMDTHCFVTGGTLLGPVRQGHILPHDDDADLAYLSPHQNPTDIVLESFEMERLLVRRGYEVVRHSAGHLQVMFPGRSLSDDFYIDIFTYFVCNGFFYGTFHAREPARSVTINPLSQVDVNGRPMPAPASTDEMLSAIYGPEWRTPDPAFTFVTPRAAQDRFYWWLNHFDAHREDWEDFHRMLIGSDAADLPPGGHQADGDGDLEWIESEVGHRHSVVELGCGLGAVSRRLAAGRQVVAVDFSRPAVWAAASAGSGNPRFELANVYAMRDVLGLLRTVRDLPRPVDVVANHLLDCIHHLGIDNVLFACRHLLGREGRALFSVWLPALDDDASRRSMEPAGDRIFDPEHFAGRVETFGLVIEDVVHTRSLDGDDPGLRYIIRKAQ